MSSADARLHAVAQQFGAVVVPQETVALNDDLIHPVVIMTSEGDVIPGIQLKDLESDVPNGLVVEMAYVPEFLRALQAVAARLPELETALETP